MSGIHDIARKAGLKDTEVQSVFGAVLELVNGFDDAGKPLRVQVKGFGSFTCSTLAARTISSPVLASGTAEVPQRQVLRFKASPTTKAYLNGQGELPAIGDGTEESTEESAEEPAEDTEEAAEPTEEVEEPAPPPPAKAAPAKPAPAPAKATPAKAAPAPAKPAPAPAPAKAAPKPAPAPAKAAPAKAAPKKAPPPPPAEEVEEEEEAPGQFAGE